MRHWGLANDDLSTIQDQVYYPLTEVPDGLVRLFSSVMSIVIQTDGPPLDTLQALDRQARGTAGDQALYDVHTMEELVGASLAQQRFLLFLFGAFSGVALLLACIGLYSVVAYLTSQRVPEFGLRIAVGANSANIVRIVLRESVVIIFAGSAIGILSSMATEHVVQHLAPIAQAPLTSTFGLVLPVLIAIALFASYIPAPRAAKVDPMVALRYE